MNLQNKKIALDIDDVVAEFAKFFLEYLDLDRTIPTDWEDDRYIKYYHLISGDKNFWLNIPPIITAKELNFRPIKFVTARPHVDWTIEWLEKHGFEGIPVLSSGYNGSKASFLQDVDFFVDDALHNYHDLNKKGVNCVLMDRPHNQHENVEKRIYHLNEIWISKQH